MPGPAMAPVERLVPRQARAAMPLAPDLALVADALDRADRSLANLQDIARSLADELGYAREATGALRWAIGQVKSG